MFPGSGFAKLEITGNWKKAKSTTAERRKHHLAETMQKAKEEGMIFNRIFHFLPDISFSVLFACIPSLRLGKPFCGAACKLNCTNSAMEGTRLSIEYSDRVKWKWNVKHRTPVPMERVGAGMVVQTHTHTQPPPVRRLVVFNLFPLHILIF